MESDMETSLRLDSLDIPLGIPGPHSDSENKIGKILLILHLVTCYGMLGSFIYQGYGVISITFSTLSLVMNYIYSIQKIKQLLRLKPRNYYSWIIIGLALNLISTLGTFTLIYLMATKTIDQTLYFSSVYFYLHFQYNGWFFFCLLGILIYIFSDSNERMNFSLEIFLLISGFVLTFILSILWMRLPILIVMIGTTGSLLQLIGWVILVVKLKKKIESVLKFQTERLIFYLISIALIIKFTLQIGSSIPYLNQLVFGMRPVVISYLHLVLLVIVSLFILLIAINLKAINLSNKQNINIKILVYAILINQLLLCIQAVSSFTYFSVPGINALLVASALLISVILVLIVFRFELNEK
ncbi:MAG: hypothetical protein MUE72_02040 [Chitinophagaceae bacterium]|nr:hypothetical protein [Chitinophagaceae bacterium]